MSSRLAVASAPSVAEVAMTMLVRGNALDAVVAGVFAACAVSPSVLFGPVQLLIGGPGAGLCAIDGRTRQPGRGAARPRGFVATDVIPAAARIAVPCLPAALAVALAMGGSCTLSQVVGEGADLAKGASEARYRFLKSIGRGGPSILTSDSVASEIVAAAGKIAGGIVTRDDLEAVRPLVETPTATLRDEQRVLAAPWRDLPAGAEAVPSGFTEIVAASDERGLIAIACYESPLDGLAIDEFGIIAPFCAAPVLRGEPRVQPGTPRSAPCPIELREHEGWLVRAIGTNGAGRLVGIARSRRSARGLSSVDPLP